MARMRILDHGYVGLVESWGSDERIIEAARMSTGKGFLGWRPLWECETCGETWEGYECAANAGGVPGCQTKGCVFPSMKKKRNGDERLLRYLWTRKHTTPFETPGMTVEVCCPVVVVWQWVRHRTMSYNILSGRYAEMPEDDYAPTLGRCLTDGGGNKQAGAADGAPPLTKEGVAAWLSRLAESQALAQAAYREGLAAGVPKELARLSLGFSRFTRMMVSANLLNWLRFLTLRTAADAQFEIRQYANAVGDLVAAYFPRTWELFAEAAP